MKNLALFAMVSLGTSVLQAESSRDSPFPDFGPGYLTFYLDNDLFANEDQDYTNGARIAWISENRKLEDIGSIQRALRPFTGDEHSLRAFRGITGFDDPSNVQYNYGFSLTQLMFTPEDFSSLTQPEGQRRYAGWSALGFSLHTKDDQTLNSVEFIVGVTGKLSYAQEVQDFIHDIRDIDKFLGWDNQIPTEVTADLSFVQKRRLNFGRRDQVLSMDGVGEWGMRLGSFRTSAHVGGMLRMGLFLPADFTDPRLSETAYANKYFTSESVLKSNWSLFLLAGFRGTAVAHDATLDGPIFHDFSTGNTREPFVGEVYAGVGMRIKSVEVAYAHTWRSIEYDEQIDPASFGTLSIRFQF
jgi:lipid A 3-O-deacylase